MKRPVRTLVCLLLVPPIAGVAGALHAQADPLSVRRISYSGAERSSRTFLNSSGETSL